MNQEWSELNKQIQLQIKKKDTFAEGKETLLLLRKQLMEEMLSFRNKLTEEQFSAIPFMNAKGYHSKTVAYSLYHIFRIEDIVANSLIQKNEEVYFAYDFQKKMHAPIITTGNELVKQEIADFSKQLDIDVLYQYILKVDEETTEWIKQLQFSDLKTKFTKEDQDALHELHVVSDSELATWLIDYWCGKNVQGLIQMPFSRHWIMHVEACLRIIDKIQ